MTVNSYGAGMAETGSRAFSIGMPPAEACVINLPVAKMNVR